MTGQTAAAYADQRVVRVRDDPQARLALMRSLYEVPPAQDQGYLPYRRAASAFMRWQLRRGLLEPGDAPAPGSPWWRAVNETLLWDTCEASALAFGHPGEPSTPGSAATLAFIRTPTALTWYDAHIVSVATAYVAHERLAEQENRVERFFINLVLVRVLYAHALVANPQLALGRLAPLGRLLGDPRLGMTGIFMSMSRVLPDSYPLDGELEDHVRGEGRLGHVLDVGIIVPRLEPLYDWSAHQLGVPALQGFLGGGADTPIYAWSPDDAQVWRPHPSRLARVAARVVPGHGTSR